MALLALEMGKCMLVQSMRYPALIGTWDLEENFGRRDLILISDPGGEKCHEEHLFFFSLGIIRQT
jgi:hypothetical protein